MRITKVNSQSSKDLWTIRQEDKTNRISKHSVSLQGQNLLFERYTSNQECKVTTLKATFNVAFKHTKNYTLKLPKQEISHEIP